jgi:ATP-dependent phosphofructokinase / diphosphate-dependent phosphofructokinase
MIVSPVSTQIQKIGILVGGGPAPGINSVIHAVAMEADRNQHVAFGIYDGFRHLMEGQLVGMPLSPEKVGYIYAEGGSILHSARANPTRSPESLKQCALVLQKAGINALVSIGGDDTAFSASRLAAYAQNQMGLDFRSVHVPKTIDNDLPLPEDVPTFGYETAREAGTRLVMNLKRDARTMHHWFLVLTMGRQSGHLALGIGQSATATLTLIPEEWTGKQVHLHEVVDILVTTMLMRLAEGKPYGVAVLAEGILENLAQGDLDTLEHVERDEHGHVKLAEVNFLDILKERIDQELNRLGLKLKIVKHLLGYELRCAPPCAFDIEYTRCLGGAAVDFLLTGGTNAIITLQHGKIVPIPYAEMIDPETGRTAVRYVNINSLRYQSAYQFMTRLKPEQAGNEALIAKLAGIAHQTASEFQNRYAYLFKPLERG